MKGKIAFVLGAAVGYVLGARAGRERYEQIKRGADAVWHTAPVQRGVSAVREVAQDKLEDLKKNASRAGKNAVAAFLRDDTQSSQRSSSHRSSSGNAAGTRPAQRDASAANAGADIAAERMSSEKASAASGEASADGGQKRADKSGSKSSGSRARSSKAGEDV